jgi:glucokinase
VSELVVGVDLGGTKLTGALVDADGTLEGLTRWPRPVREYGETIDALSAIVDGLRARAAELGRPVTALGMAVAAWLDAERSGVLQAANLGWRDRPLRADVSRRVGLPVVLVNDGDAAAWGEYRFGAGAEARSLLLVTIGTGVGGGVVIDGRPLTGGSGLGGELGHLAVQADGLPCACGARGCLEMYASATALVRRARECARAEPGAAELLLRLAGGDADRIDGPVVVTAARGGDRVATEALEQIGRWLGRGLAQATAVVDPTLILVGGGLAAAGELLLAPARSAYADALPAQSVRREAPIRLAALGAAAGLVGVAERARASLAAAALAQ